MSHAFIRRTLTMAAAGALLATNALAMVESSCPAPCTVPPKTSIFVRETGALGTGGYIYVPGTLQKGLKKTVLRVDATFVVDVDPTLPGLWLRPKVNGIKIDGPLTLTVCDSARAANCTISATFWWDLDALEAAHPGEFIGKPLEIMLEGGNMFGSGQGMEFQASLAATLVKKQ